MKARILHFLLLGVLLTMCIGSGSLLAQAPGHGDIGRAMEVVTRFLDLTENQREDFATILKENRDAINSLEAQQRVLRKELDELLDSGEYDLVEVGAYTEEIHDLGHQIRDIRSSMIDSLLLILDEEQEQKSKIVRRAAVFQPVVHAYQRLGLLPPIVRPPAPVEEPEE